jgi:hypothetical protein
MLFLEKPTIEGVESVVAGVYWRSVRLERGDRQYCGWI